MVRERRGLFLESGGLVAVIFAAFLLSGCLISGYIPGVMDDGERVVLHYEGDRYTTVINGEFFAGRAVDVGGVSTTATYWGPRYYVYPPEIDPPDIGSPDERFPLSASARSPFPTEVVSRRSSGRFSAVLLGSGGSTLSCSLNYAMAGTPAGGGVGLCKLSDGRSLQVSW